MPNILGYIRAEINEKNLRVQFDQLKAAQVSKIYREKPSDNKCNRPQWDKLMAEALVGDTVVVTSINRVAHNAKHLLEILESLNAAGVTFKAIDSGIDTSTSHGEVLRLLLGALVDFERQVLRERQSAGIAQAKREGRYKGRKPTARAKAGEVLALNEKGLTRQMIADELGIGVASVYRILKTHTAPKKPGREVVKKSEKTPVAKKKRVERKPSRAADAEQLSLFLPAKPLSDL